MSVFDKELIINGKAVRSPEQQVYKNMEDIKTLFEKIQTWYNCSEELDEEDNTVLRSYTNVPDSASSGLLIDPVGNMFSITGGDETTLLITFYASIKGPQGEQGESGAELEIDDTGTSATKVWSSQKVSQELANAGKFYKHFITLHKSNHSYYVYLVIDSSSATEFTFATLQDFLRLKGFNAYEKIYPAYSDSTAKVIGVWYYSDQPTEIIVKGLDSNLSYDDSVTVTDNVIQP